MNWDRLLAWEAWLVLAVAFLVGLVVGLEITRRITAAELKASRIDWACLRVLERRQQTMARNIRKVAVRAGVQLKELEDERDS